MNNYELLFILDPVVEESKRQAMIETVKEIIAEGGEVGEVEVWGTRKLAYPIRKKSEGFYVLVNFSAEPDLPKELDRRLKIADSVMRHLIINKDAQ